MKSVFHMILVLIVSNSSAANAQDFPSREQAEAALQKAVRFYRKNVGVQGGSVYRVSSDLKKREGETRVGPLEAWIEPPATGAVGMAYVHAWKLTNLPVFKEAMLETADGLIRGQLDSGGWGENIEFDPDLRPRYAYRVDPRTDSKNRKYHSTFDDNKSQSSLQCLMLTDQALDFKNQQIHEAAMYALNAFVDAQYPNGAWPQRFPADAPNVENAQLKASFPDSWSRTYQKVSYSKFYTLNDNTISDLIRLMLIAHEIYQDDQWLDAAKRGGEFLLLAQLPEPQPGWAQQYNERMQPEWARKFEPPAISGLESQGAMEVLLLLYDKTGEERFLKPIPRALEYYRSIQFKDGQLARFYEMGTDKPLYFTRDYKLVYTDDDLPTHYGFKVGSKLDRLESQYKSLRSNGPSKRSLIRSARAPKMSESLAKRTAEVIRSLDQRGAWVQDGSMKNFDGVSKVIDTRTYTRNILTLADFIAAAKK